MTAEKKKTSHRVIMRMSFSRPVTQAAALRAARNEFSHTPFHATLEEENADGWSDFKVTGMGRLKPPEKNKATRWLYVLNESGRLFLMASRSSWMFHNGIKKDEARAKLLEGGEGDILLAEISSLEGNTPKDFDDFTTMLASLFD